VTALPARPRRSRRTCGGRRNVECCSPSRARSSCTRRRRWLVHASRPRSTGRVIADGASLREPGRGRPRARCCDGVGTRSRAFTITRATGYSSAPGGGMPGLRVRSITTLTARRRRDRRSTGTRCDPRQQVLDREERLEVGVALLNDLPLLVPRDRTVRGAVEPHQAGLADDRPVRRRVLRVPGGRQQRAEDGRRELARREKRSRGRYSGTKRIGSTAAGSRTRARRSPRGLSAARRVTSSFRDRGLVVSLVGAAADVPRRRAAPEAASENGAYDPSCAVTSTRVAAGRAACRAQGARVSEVDASGFVAPVGSAH
jgi:hypothetical protein